MGLSKVQHLFSNIHIPRKVLCAMNDKLVSLVRSWLGLNSHSTRNIIFHPQWEGGLGVPNVEWIYTSMRISHLLRMLNNDDEDVRKLARSSLFLDMRRRKVPVARGAEPHFLGFKRKASGKLDTHSAGFGVWSDWPDLNDLCIRTGVSLEWVRSDSEMVAVSEDCISDPLTQVRAIAHFAGQSRLLTSKGARRTLMDLHQHQQQQHWTGLKLQGKLACLPTADHSVSHSFIKNTALNEDIVIFTIKSRLQVLPTRLNLSIWFPSTQVPHCLHHTTEPVTESLSHILNGCYAYKGMYIARHDRIVDLIVKEVSHHLSDSVAMYTHTQVNASMFRLCNDQHAFSLLSANTPDVVVVNTLDANDIYSRHGFPTAERHLTAIDVKKQKPFFSRLLFFRLLSITFTMFDCPGTRSFLTAVRQSWVGPAPLPLISTTSWICIACKRHYSRGW